MTVLSQTTILGALELIEVYEFYDRPVLFACRNIVGVTFLAVWVDSDDNSETWLYVPMSSHRFEHVRSGFIDLYSAFVEPEDGFVYEVVVPIHSEDRIVVQALGAKTLLETRLPTPGERLALTTQTLPVSSATLA